MKGLIIKDLVTIKAIRKNLVFFVGLGLIFLLVNKNPSMFITYMGMASYSLVLASIAYDEADNGLAYQMTLPITRKSYVNGKYLLFIMSMIVMSVFSFGFSYIAMKCFIKESISIDELTSIFLGVSLVISIMTAISIPVNIKFGQEKARTVFIVVFGGMTLIGALVGKFAKDKFATILQGLKPLIENEFGLLGIALAIIVLIFGISYLLSLKFMMEKEF